MVINYKLENIQNTAETIFDLYKNYKVWKFYGNLGSGKTSFIASLKKVLQINEHITSPTFSIINQYTTINNLSIIHIDLYRINNLNELIELDLERIISNSDYCFIEWSERLPPNIFTNSISLIFNHISANKSKYRNLQCQEKGLENS